MKNQKGQILILLLLVMLVTLTFALAIAQHSLTYLSNSNKSEQGTRAFSVAQAGIEQALKGSNNVSVPLLSNQASASIAPAPLLPPPANNEAIEYPPIGKDTPAQFWAIDPSNQSNFTSTTGPSAYSSFSSSATFIVYYGNYNFANPSDPTSYMNLTNKPAVEINYVTFDSINKVYLSHKYLYDGDSQRSSGKLANASTATCSSSPTPIATTTNSVSAGGRYFACATPALPPALLPTSEIPVMIRVRLLYSDISQVVAVQPQNGSAFPPQVQIFNSVGYSGQTQKAIQVFKAPFVVPPFFDYAIFAQTNIKK